MFIHNGMRYFDKEDLLNISHINDQVRAIEDAVKKKEIGINNLEIFRRDLSKWDYYYGKENIIIYSKRAIEELVLLKNTQELASDPLLMGKRTQLENKTFSQEIKVERFTEEDKDNLTVSGIMKIEQFNGNWKLYNIWVPDLVSFLASTPNYECNLCKKMITSHEAKINPKTREVRCDKCKDINFEPIY